MSAGMQVVMGRCESALDRVAEQQSVLIDQIAGAQYRFEDVKNQVENHVSLIRNELGENLPWAAGRPVPFGPANTQWFAHSGRTMEQIRLYREILAEIREHHESIRFSIPWLKEIHQRADLTDNAKIKSTGEFKQQENRIHQISGEDGFRTALPEQTSSAMNELHEAFDDLWRRRPELRLMVAFVYRLDILTIHPFDNGNGRTSRLVLMLHLYKAGYPICDLWNLDEAVYRNRLSDSLALNQSRKSFTSIDFDIAPTVLFWLKILADQYQYLERLADKGFDLSNVG